METYSYHISDSNDIIFILNDCIIIFLIFNATLLLSPGPPCISIKDLSA